MSPNDPNQPNQSQGDQATQANPTTPGQTQQVTGGGQPAGGQQQQAPQQQQQQDQQTAQQLHDQLQAHLGSADSGVPAGAGAGTAGDFARGLLDAFRNISPEQWAAFLAFARSTGLLKF